ncbi:MAG TPA: hypothetical protein DCS28_00395 [Candidatus Moranbacteria bacterium]|nr:hypothetical protein [Candidatus Moranbacteria bacterium]HAT74490.1 hypothetical protein [Candidatus Moranbacteria bacterium]
MYSSLMKYFYIFRSRRISLWLIVFLFSLFFSPLICLAQEIDLGFFTVQGLNSKLSADFILKIKDAKISLPASEISDWLKKEASLDYDENYKSEIENGNLCAYRKLLACALSFDYRHENKIKKKIFVKLDADLAENYIAMLAKKINREPADSRLKMEDGKVSVFSLSEKGLELDENKSLEILTNYLKNKNTSNSIELPYQEIEPAIAVNSVDNMEIDSLIGEGRSNFRGSPKNRVFNIKVASERFNGILIKPGENFSFVNVLGEVDGEHGYLPELVIKKDKTEPEFGGGICQVSTTAFRAAIYSGLEITVRRNHAYPVSYYNPQGMDATVYVPRPDLRFKNDTPNYILIQTKIEGTELIFQFYGTSDGRKTTIVGPTILEKNPDGSMKTTFTQQVYDKNDNLIREDIFKSNYDSPNKYPHPGSGDLLTEKPKDWSKKEWGKYKKEYNMSQ